MKIVCTMPLDETVRAQILRAAGDGAEVVDGRNREELIPRAEGAAVIYGGVWPER